MLKCFEIEHRPSEIENKSLKYYAFSDFGFTGFSEFVLTNNMSYQKCWDFGMFRLKKAIISSDFLVQILQSLL